MKFRRILSTLLVLTMLLVCLPVQTHAEEQRASLMPKRFEQLETIINPQTGVYLFTTFKDLQDIIHKAESDPNNEYAAILNTDDQIFITKNLRIPENLVLAADEGEFMVEAGATLTVVGVMQAKRLIVYGKVDVKNTGYLYISGHLMLSDQYDSGFMTLDGILYLEYGLENKLFGAERITYGKTGSVVCNGTFENEEQLRSACAVAAAADSHWAYYLDNRGVRITLKEDLFIPANCVIDGSGTVFGSEDVVEITLAGAIVAESYFATSYRMTILPSGGMFIGDDAFFERGLVNLGLIEIANGIEGYHGQITFNDPGVYSDSSPYGSGAILVMTEAGKEFPAKALPDFDVNDFSVDWEQIDGVSVWTLTGYQGFHEHTVITNPAVAPTCLDYGRSEESYCLICREEFAKLEVLAPLGHSYTDPWDTTCNVCGAERKVDKSHLTYSMYRLYDPFSGEHFYTGSMEERQMLEANGWKYEGVGFTFPYSSGKPVYRLYDRNQTHEHLYTMDEEEKDALIAAGWEFEGIAFNSCPREEVPQYRLRNPNTTCGAYHFTASEEERDTLIAAGWIYEGIGFYTCLQ